MLAQAPEQVLGRVGGLEGRGALCLFFERAHDPVEALGPGPGEVLELTERGAACQARRRDRLVRGVGAELGQGGPRGGTLAASRQVLDLA